MRTILICLCSIVPFLAVGQFQAKETLTVSEAQGDDTYLAGESVRVNARVNGDLVVAGGDIILRDSLEQDLIVAGGQVEVNGVVGDDIRAMAGTLTLTNEVWDDLVVFGGEVHVLEGAHIHGNLINYSGTIRLEGQVDGALKAYGGTLDIQGTIGDGMELYGGEITINGDIAGQVTMVADKITIGEFATFDGDVTYWTKDGEIDFGNSLTNGFASFDPSLEKDYKGMSWGWLGMASLGFWLFYLLSATLVLVLLHWIFSRWLHRVAEHLSDQPWRGFGFGILYLLGLPLVISIFIFTVIGIPIGVFLLTFYLFSIFFGHLMAAALAAQYWQTRLEKPINFWLLVGLSLGFAILFRLMTLIPFLGLFLSLILLALAYGPLLSLLLNRKKGDAGRIIEFPDNI